MLPKTILVIEDEPTILANLAELLECNGYLPLLASDGYSGLHMALTYQPDLILCDVKVVGLSGFEIYERLRSEGIDIPFVFQTALVEKRIVKQLEKMGKVVEKPFFHEDIMSVIDSVFLERGK